MVDPQAAGTVAGVGDRLRVLGDSPGVRLGVTAAQVRRDVMELGYLGNPAKGYRVVDLLDRIGAILDATESQAAVLVGAGRLGSALVSHFTNWSPKLKIVGVFDTDPAKIDTEVYGHACLKLSELPRVIKRYKVDVGIIAVPVRGRGRRRQDDGRRRGQGRAQLCPGSTQRSRRGVRRTGGPDRVHRAGRLHGPRCSAAALPGGSDPGNPVSDDMTSVPLILQRKRELALRDRLVMLRARS